MAMKRRLLVLWVLALVITGAACAPGQATRLERQFVSPPDSARPWVYWMWMDGNLSRDGITADLEAMKQAGIGGVVICEVNVGVPRGPVEFMSPKWRKLFKDVVRKAQRLGLECDKLDKAALDSHFDAFVGALLRETGPRKTSAGAGWTFLHIDSWEMGAQNWTGIFREEFQRRRGYDLFPYLPAMTGRIVDSLEVSERFLWDLRLTAQELVVENHALHLKELGRRHGFGLSIEPYDMTPCADMTLGTAADVPMGEFWLYGFHTAHSVIEAASVAHTCGRRVVAAEAFTSSEAEAWQAHPASMKALGDWAFTAGINRIVFHRYQHQPRPGLRPGMTMGPYGVHWERTQTWWDMVPAYHAYLTRCQFMLRQGLPVADLCYLVGEGAPHVFRAPSTALRGDPPDRLGYNFDGCAPETLLTSMSVKDGKLVLPDGMTYRVLILPEQETMTPALLRKVKELIAAGATVVGPRPQKSPSLSGYPACDAEVQRLAEELWGKDEGERATERAYGRGRLVSEGGPTTVPAPSLLGTEATGTVHPDKTTWDVGAPPLSEPEQYGDFALVTGVLEKMGVPPDFESEAGLRYTHRRDGETDIYFVANAEDYSLDTTCIFRVTGKQPELWDAVTGEIRRLDEFRLACGRTSVPLRIEPHQSFFIVFRKPAAGAKPAQRNFPLQEKVADIGGPWDVTFDPNLGGPGKITFNTLEDWTGRPEGGIRFYSGPATYRTTFDLSVSAEAAAKTEHRGPRRIRLDLGTVKNIARVRLNGRELGVVWCAPWRVDISDVVKASGNRLEIAVANLWANRLIGDERLPPDGEYGEGGNLARWPEWLLQGEPRPSQGRITFTTWKNYTKDSPLLPSGLLGPVTIGEVLRFSSGASRQRT